MDGGDTLKASPKVRDDEWPIYISVYTICKDLFMVEFVVVKFK